MNNNLNIKEIERKAYLNYHKDGILDIYIGLVILTLAFNLIDNEYSMVWMIALFPICYRDSKRRYTFPRLGYVKFNKKTGKSRNATIFTIGLATLTFIVGILVFFKGNQSGISFLVPFIKNWKWVTAIIGALVFSLFGYTTELKRLYYYAISSFLIFATGAVTPINGFILIVTFAGVISLSGVYQLYNFTQEYPVEKRAENE